MKLFLTSTAHQVLDKIVPLLPKEPNKSSVLFIPTAGTLYQETPWINEDRKKLIELGFQVHDFDLKDKTADEVKNALDQTDIVFVAGGNTFYLLEYVRKSGFEQHIKEFVANDKVYIGSSAGSVITGPDIEAVKFFDDPMEANLETTKGLGLIDSVIIPHADKERYSPGLEKMLEEYADNYKFTFVNDDQMVIVDN